MRRDGWIGWAHQDPQQRRKEDVLFTMTDAERAALLRKQQGPPEKY
eukprot:gene2209-1603_t